MNRISRYLNPIERLGSGDYAFIFPLVANVVLCIVSEFITYNVLHDPIAVGMYIIFCNVVFIIYFAFRDGIIGGLISVVFSVLYYFYIIFTRHYKGAQFVSGLDTTIELGLVYLALAFTIGWLKQTIDKLIGREANEKIWLQSILQQLAVGVIIADNRGRVVQTNKQVEQILGVKIPAGFMMEKDKVLVPNVSIPISPDPAQLPLYQTLNSKKPVVGTEFSILRKDGKKVFIQVSSSTVRNKKKNIIAQASIIADITEQKELERQKDDFLSMASHELKTPITSLKMFIDLQRQQLKEKNAGKAAYFNERIHDQADRLKELANDLLDVSRIQTNKLRFTMEDFDIASVINDTVEDLQGTTQRHEILVKGVVSQEVRGDRYRIYQVLVNLLLNAIKYSPAGKKIFVQAKRNGKSIVVSVRDSGIGISRGQQDKIFDKLYQVADPQVKTFPGLGLGLYISKEIVERHKGKIWVKSTKGKGSTFFFSLPLIK